MKKMGKIHNFSNKILLNSKLLKKMKNKINNFRNKKKKCIITKKETRKYKIKINNVLHDVKNTSNTHVNPLKDQCFFFFFLFSWGPPEEVCLAFIFQDVGDPSPCMGRAAAGGWWLAMLADGWTAGQVVACQGRKEDEDFKEKDKREKRKEKNEGGGDLKRGRDFQVWALRISFFIFFITSFFMHLSGVSLAFICYWGILSLCFLCHLLRAFSSKVNPDSIWVMPLTTEPVYVGMKWVPMIVCLFYYFGKCSVWGCSSLFLFFFSFLVPQSLSSNTRVEITCHSAGDHAYVRIDSPAGGPAHTAALRQRRSLPSPPLWNPIIET